MYSHCLLEPGSPRSTWFQERAALCVPSPGPCPSSLVGLLMLTLLLCLFPGVLLIKKDRGGKQADGHQAPVRLWGTG